MVQFKQQLAAVYEYNLQSKLYEEQNRKEVSAMSELSYNLLASDLDSTMITETLTLPAVNIAAVERARNAGCHVAICSGRATNSLLYYEEQLGLIGEGCYGISFNGSIVYETDTRKVIRDIRLGDSLAMDIIERLADYGANPWIYVGDELYVTKATEWAREYARHVKTKFTVVDSFRGLDGEITKVQVADLRPNLEKLDEHFLALDDSRYNNFFTADFLYEFTAQDATKGKALAFLANRLGVPIAKTIAIGDNLNDVHMIQTAGLSVAVNNARHELKALADYVTRRDCGQGAVAEVIEKFVLKG